MGIIDERILKMVFDNTQFQSGIEESTEALKEFKAELDSTGTTVAASKMSSVLSDAFDSIGDKVSYLDTVVTGFFTQLGYDAARTAENIISSFSGIGNIQLGYSKYESEATAVQTILSATRNAGETMDTVTSHLAKLMWYADETSYSFSDMTTGIGSFTTAGVGLDDATNAMIGISNWAASAGANSQKAGIAIHNLSQAMGTGYLKVADWASIESAGMATVEVEEQFIKSAVKLGKLKEKDGKYYTTKGNKEVNTSTFRNTLQYGWLDKSVMMETFGTYSKFTNKVYDSKDDFDTTSEAIADLADGTDELGENAFRAAQEAKTYTEAIGSVTEAVSSGWQKTFDYIFGNYEEAKEIWTGLANALWDVFAAGGDARNEILKTWHSLEAGQGGYTDFKQALMNIFDVMSDIGDLLNDMFPSLDITWLQSLTTGFLNATSAAKEFFDNIYNFRHPEEAGKATVPEVDATSSADQPVKNSEEIRENTEKTAKLYSKLPKWMKRWADAGKGANFPGGRGWSKKNIKLWAQYQASLGKGNADDIEDQILAYDNLTDKQKRLIDSGAGKDASHGKKWEAYWEATERVTKATEHDTEAKEDNTDANGAVSESTVELTKDQRNLLRITDGIKAGFNIFLRVLGDLKDGLVGLWDALKPVRDAFGDIFADIADGLVDLDKSMEENDLFGGVITDIITFLTPMFQRLADAITWTWQAIKDIYAALKDAGIIDQVSKSITDFYNSIKQFGVDVNGSDIWENIHQFFEDLKQGIISFITTDTSDSETWLDALKKRLSGFQPLIDFISSFFSFFTVKDEKNNQSFIDKFVEYFGSFFGGIGNLLSGIGDFLGRISLGDIFTLTKSLLLAKAGLSGLFAVISGFNFVNSITGVVRNVNRTMKYNIASDMIARVTNMMMALVAIAAAIYVLSTIEPGKLVLAASVMLIMAGMFAVIFIALENISKNDLKGAATQLMQGIAFAGVLLSFAVAMVAFAVAVKILSTIDLAGAAIGVGSFVIVLAAVSLAVAFLTNGNSSIKASLTGMGMLLALSVAMIAFAVSIKLLSTIDMDSALIGIDAFIIALAAITIATKLLTSGSSSAKSSITALGVLVGLSVAMVAFAVSIKMLSTMSIQSATVGILAFTIALMAIAVVTNYLTGGEGSSIKKSLNTMGTLMVLSVAMIAFAVSIRLLATMNLESASVAILSFAAIMAVLAIFLKSITGMGFKGAFSSLQIMIGVSAMILAMAFSMKMLSTMSLAGADIAVISMLAICIAMKVLIDSISKLDMKSMGKILLFAAGLSLILVAFSLAMFIASGIDWTSMLAFGVSLSAVILTLSIAMKLLRYMPLGPAIKAIAILSIAIIAIAAVLTLCVKLFADSVMTSMVNVGSYLEIFGQEIGSFIGQMSQYSQEEVDRVAKIFETIFGIILGMPIVLSLDVFTNFATALNSLHSGLVLFLGQGEDASVSVDTKIAQIQKLSELIETIQNGSYDNIDPFITTIERLGAAMTLFNGSGTADAGASVGSAIDLLEQLVTGIPEDLGTTMSTIPESGNLDTFALSLVSLGGGLLNFSNSVAGVDQGAVDNAITSLTLLNNLDASLQAHNAIFGVLLGASGLDTFATSVANVGNGLYQFYVAVKDINPASVLFATGSLGILAALDSSLTAHGGIISWFNGDNDLGTFGTKLNTLGWGLKNFSDKVKDIDSGKVTAASNATKLLVDLDSSLTDHGGIFSWFTGDQDLSSFGSTLEGLGDGLLKFSQKVDKIKDTSTVESMITSIKKIGSIKVDSDLNDFISKVDDLGTNFATFVKKMNEAKDISNPDRFESYIKLIERIGQIQASANFASFASNLPALGSGLKSFIQYLNSDADAFQTFELTDTVESYVQLIERLSTATAEAPAMPTITPVLNFEQLDVDMASLSTRYADFKLLVNGLDVGDVSSKIEVNVTSNYDDSDVRTAIKTLGEKIDSLGSDMSRLKVYLNTGVLVGQITPLVDKALGASTKNKLRGGTGTP